MTNDQIGDAHARYADWDAAYVLGSLSSPERQEFERHLHGCQRCTDAVADLAGLPGLLGRVDPADVDALLSPDPLLAGALLNRTGPADPAETGSAPADLVARIERADRLDREHRDRAALDELAIRRRRTVRRRATILVAAAVVAAAAIVVPIVLTNRDTPTASAELTQTSANPLSADVQLYGESWGTRITMTCAYAANGGWAEKQPASAWTYALYVVDYAGTASEVSSWTAQRGSIVHATATTSIDISDIDIVQVRSVETGKVLLSSDLG